MDGERERERERERGERERERGNDGKNVEEEMLVNMDCVLLYAVYYSCV